MRLCVLVFAGFLGIAYALERREFDRFLLVRAVREAAGNHAKLSLVLMTAGFAGTLIAAGLIRHAALESRGFDLGIFAQALWNTAHGLPQYSSLKGGISLLGDHVSFLLFPLSPLYSLWPDPQNLIILQALMTAACLPLIAAFTREETGDWTAALAFVLAFCFYLPVRSPIHEDFHPEILVKPFMIAAFMLLKKNRTLPFLLCLAVIASAKENMLLIPFIFGVYAFLFLKKRGLGLVLMIVSALLLVWEVKWVVPYFSGHASLYEGSYKHLDSWRAWLGFLFRSDVLSYAAKIFSPFLFLSFLHPTILLTLPTFAQNVLSRNETYMSLNYHYTAGLSLFVVISAVYGYKNLLRRPVLQANRNWILFALLAVAVLRSGPSEAFFMWESSQGLTAHNAVVRGQLRALPSASSVLTHNNFIAQTPNHKEVWQFDYNGEPSKAEQARRLKPDFVVWDESFWEPGTRPAGEERPQMTALGYEPQFESEGFALWRRKPG